LDNHGTVRKGVSEERDSIIMDNEKPREGEPIQESLVLSFTVVDGAFTAKLTSGKGGVVQAGSVASRQIVVKVEGTSYINTVDGAGELRLDLFEKLKL
jgi:hypothetical protein